ncbi:hypothetical protein BV25DRAFT_1775824, partial [Artomyces pyxidatus]
RGILSCPKQGCTQVCRSSGDLARHLMVLGHHEPSFPCVWCGKRFTREDALKRHRVRVKACPGWVH